ARDDHAESIELIGVSRRARRRSLGVLARKKIEERAETRLGDVLPIDRENARRSGAQKKIERDASGLAPLQAPRSTPAHATLAPRSRFAVGPEVELIEQGGKRIDLALVKRPRGERPGDQLDERGTT